MHTFCKTPERNVAEVKSTRAFLFPAAGSSGAAVEAGKVPFRRRQYLGSLLIQCLLSAMEMEQNSLGQRWEGLDVWSS